MEITTEWGIQRKTWNAFGISGTERLSIAFAKECTILICILNINLNCVSEKQMNFTSHFSFCNSKITYFPVFTGCLFTRRIIEVSLELSTGTKVLGYKIDTCLNSLDSNDVVVFLPSFLTLSSHWMNSSWTYGKTVTSIFATLRLNSLLLI